jgi:hypothetical protein
MDMAHETAGDGLIPAVNFEGMPESYWTERNALVDRVRAALRADTYLQKTKNLHVGDVFPDKTADDLRTNAAYHAANDALKAFDAAHGGTPIL